jgi:5'-nucleotidase
MNIDNIGQFDLDGSLADYEGQMQFDMEAMQGPTEPPFDVSMLWGKNAPEHLKQRERAIKRQPGWWANLLPIKEGLYVYNVAKRMGFDNRVLTRGPQSNPHAWKEKVEWCQKNLGPDASITITRDKSTAYGKFLYDDFPPYMLKWLANRPRGLGIMPANRHNEGFSHPQVFRWDGQDIPRLERVLQSCFDRPSKSPLVIPD